MTLVEAYKHALEEYFGKPYVWGAEGPLAYDCSGLVRCILGPFKVLPPTRDQSADDLYRWFLDKSFLNVSGLGSLAFFGTPMNIVHIGFCIDEYSMINASGGGSHVKTIEVAKRVNASVKIEPIHYRSNLIAVLKPLYFFQ